MLKRLPNRSIWLSYLIIALGIAALPTAIAATSSDLKKLLKSVYCYCGCSRETIEVCVCGVAQDIKNEFKKLLSQGQSTEEIKAKYLDQYGSQFDAIMKAEGFNLVAYIAPFFFLMIFGCIAIMVIQKSKISSSSASTKKLFGNNDFKQLEKQVEEYRKRR